MLLPFKVGWLRGNITIKSKMSLYKNKYRVESTRLQKWNYGWNAKYYVTIITKDRKYFFGNIENQNMILSEIGRILKNECEKTSSIRPDMNIKLDEFVIMPNHIHGIIEIGKNKYNKWNGIINNLQNGNGDGDGDGMKNPTMKNPTTNDTIPKYEKTKNNNPTIKNQFGPQSKNLASIIRGIKSAVTIQSRKINPNFGWQRGFYDSIIQDNKEFEQIKHYIINNPKKWKDDIFY